MRQLSLVDNSNHAAVVEPDCPVGLAIDLHVRASDNDILLLADQGEK
jgi:hypothetical protein